MKSFARSFLAVLVLPLTLYAAADAAAPQRVLLMGDSLMRIPAHALERAIARYPEVEVRSFTSIGSGLARLDVLDWMERIREHVSSFNPEAAVMFIGTNDRQAMRTPAGILQPEDARWEAEYARRTGQAMDLLRNEGRTLVLWLELPDMRDEKAQEDVALINRIFERETAVRDGVEFFVTRTFLSRRPGRYSPYVLQARGMPLHIRDPDGIHLNRAGADLLAAQVERRLWPAGEVK